MKILKKIINFSIYINTFTKLIINRKNLDKFDQDYQEDKDDEDIEEDDDYENDYFDSEKVYIYIYKYKYINII